jgi:hypothetical protein
MVVLEKEGAERKGEIGVDLEGGFKGMSFGLN